MLALSTLTQGLLMPTHVPAHVALRGTTPTMACVDEFSVSRVIKDVRVFDGDCERFSITEKL